MERARRLTVQPNPGDVARPTGIRELQRVVAAASDAVTRVVVGHDAAVSAAVVCVLSGGHLLVEDLPGMGKTTLAKALASVLGFEHRRLQFTADLLPSDVTGAMVYEPDTRRLRFHPGPVFTNVVLADELNRGSPKTQSALLEAMEEHQVSVDSTTHLLPHPFIVIGTQNPFDASGTSELPHNVRDRFLFQIGFGYPDRGAEDDLLATRGRRPDPATLSPVCEPDIFDAFVSAASAAEVAPSVRSYVLDVVGATRHHPEVRVGASPRATLALVQGAAGMAIADGRGYVMPEDVKAVGGAVLGHRLVLSPAAAASGATSADVVAEIFERVPVPVGRL